MTLTDLRRTVLFNHLVGAAEQRRRHVKAKRPRGNQVDHQLELGRALHRKVGRLGALENAVDVDRRSLEQHPEIGAMDDEAPCVYRKPRPY
jgi:hypothetical protein